MLKFKSFLSKFLIIAIIATTAVISSPIPVKAASVYYVDDENGNDSMSTTEAMNINTPWKTIGKAASEAKAGDTVMIREGTYREEITPANSGTVDNYITFMAYNNEEVIVSGCDKLETGWTQESSDIYYTTMDWNLDDKNQIFVDDLMMTEARWPNQAGTLVSPTFAVTDSCTGATHIIDSDLPGSTNDFYANADLHILSGLAWIMFTSTVDAYDATTKTLTVDPLHAQAPGIYDPEADNSYYISGLKSLLDTQEEWWYDDNNDRLYLWAPGGGDPSIKKVEAKKRMNAFDLSNKSYVKIQDIKINASTIIMNDNTNHCSLDGLTCKYLSYSDRATAEHQQENLGIQLSGSNNEVRNSELAYSSSSLVSISGTYNNLINCYIHDGGYIPTYTAVVNLNGKYSLVSNNTVCDAGRSLIGWESKMYANKLQYNKIYNAGWQTTDFGCFYGGNCDAGNTEISYNIVGESRSSGPNSGIYADNYSSNLVIHHNAMYVNGGLAINGPSEYVLLFNNTAEYNCGSMVTFCPAFENDYTGTMIYNNIINGMDNTMQTYTKNGNNIDTESFVDRTNKDFHLQAGSPAIDAGIIAAGMTDGFTGTSPDIGAFEYNGTSWTAGHDFFNPPNPVYSEANVEFMNLVGSKNAGFETGDTSLWTKTGAQLATTAFFDRWNEYSATTGESRSHTYGMRLGGTSAVDGVEQVISGLTPYTTYSLSGWLRSPNGEVATIGVKNYGGGDLSASSTSNTWTQKSIQFTTGVSSSATVYFSKTSSGPDYIYCDDIGLQKVKDVNFQNSFESGFGDWIATDGMPTAVTSQKKSGSYSYVQDEEKDSIVHYTDKALNKYFAVWFYDDASDNSIETAAFVDNGTTPIGIGRDTSIGGGNCYFYRIGYVETPTSIAKSTGWHQFVFDYSSGTNVKLYIDGTLIAVSSACTSFKRISLGDCWANNRSASVYYDDIGVFDEMPPLFYDSFETGFGNWTIGGGMVTAGSFQKMSGNCSYTIDENIDNITHTTYKALNKVAVVWFYDDASDTSVESLACADNLSTVIGIGVDTTVDTNNYIYRIGSSYNNSGISRTTGWHQYAFDYTSGSDVKLYVDGKIIAISTSCTYLNRISIGDFWNNHTGSVYYDDIGIYHFMPFYDSFENGFGNWTAINGTANTSTVQKCNGSSSYILDEATDCIVHYTNQNLNKVAGVWFYDNASNTSLEAVAFADNGATPVGIGVSTSKSTSNYYYRLGSGEYASGITRSTGWHLFTFDYSSGEDVKIYIDGTLISTSTACTVLNRIALGDCWPTGSGTVYYDDISIDDYVPFRDGFESSFGKWPSASGTPTVSTTQKKSGSYSYIQNEDVENITHPFGLSLNKVAVIWFYDDAFDTSLESAAFVDDSSTTVGMGVDTSISSGYYFYRLGGREYTSSVERSIGWHKFVYDYTSKTDVKLYIDNTLILSTPICKSFNRISIGDCWTGKSGTVYYDDIGTFNYIPY